MRAAIPYDLSIIATMALLACGEAHAPADLAGQAQAANTSYSAVNGATNTQWAADKFCHPVYFGGVGAHAGAPLVSGIPTNGGFVENGWLTNWPASSLTAQPYQSGTMAATAECHAFADFHGSGWMGQTSQFDHSLSWSDNAAASPVSGSLSNLWDVNSMCWIDGVAGMSESTAAANLTTFADPSVPPGQRWRLSASGFRAHTARARCAWVGRNAAIALWYRATPQSPQATSSLLTTQGTCFIHKVFGNLDDGSVLWRKGLVWRLEVTGDVTAEGYCVPY